jgi:hypothetical protein
MTEPSDAEDDPEVVASVDGDSEAQEYVIADITTDSAWLSMDAEDAATLPAWR